MVDSVKKLSSFRKLKCVWRAKGSRLLITWLISWMTFPHTPSITSLGRVQVWIEDTPSPLSVVHHSLRSRRTKCIFHMLSQCPSEAAAVTDLWSSSNLADSNHFLSWPDNMVRSVCLLSWRKVRAPVGHCALISLLDSTAEPGGWGPAGA